MHEKQYLNFKRELGKYAVIYLSTLRKIEFRIRAIQTISTRGR